MNTYIAALINYQEIRFIVVKVADTIISNEFERKRILEAAQLDFHNNLVILFGRDVFMKFNYWGINEDIIDFLSRQDPNNFPWRIYNF